MTKQIFYFWAECEDGTRGTVDATDMKEADALVRALGHVPTFIGVLPYPAHPALCQRFDIDRTPEFCYKPDKCSRAGRCCGSYACNE